MVGAEWRKASRVWEAYQDKVKEGVHFTMEATTAIMFEAWDFLPPVFRERMEKRIWDKQYTKVHEAAKLDLADATKDYERKIAEYHAAQADYNKKIEDTKQEQRKLDNMKAAIEMAKALRTFIAAMGIRQDNIPWNNVEI